MKILTARPHRLLNAVIQEIGEAASAGNPCMLLVPSQYTLQAEIEVMTRLDLEGSFLIDVLSPARLQSRVFERAGAPDRVLFDERGKRMVLGELIEKEKDALVLYKNAAGNGGFTARVSSLIADLKRSGMHADELRLRAAQMPEDSAARAKLEDVARIFAAYESRMAGQLADAEDISAAMLERLERSEVVRGKHVFVYGFDMITQVFAAELTQIAGLCASLTVSVETDDDNAPDASLFAPVNYSLNRLAKLAKKRGIPVEIAHMNAELDAPEDIRLLEAGLFAIGLLTSPEPPEHIEVRAAGNMRSEVHAAAARIRRMLLDGADCADIAIVYPKASGYAPLLSNILPRYGIPVYIAEKRLAPSHPLCRFLLHALSAVGSGWRVADIVECVQTDFFDLPREKADAFCAYMEDCDIRAEGMRRTFTYLPDELDEDEAAEMLRDLNESRETVVAPLEAFGRALAAAKTADETIEAVVDLLQRVHAAERLEQMRGELNEAGLFSEAEDCAQVHQALMETLDQLHTLLGGRPASGKVAQRLLAEGLSALELSALPPVDGSVICGETGNVRTAEVRVLFALGLNDQTGSQDEGLLSPAEKEEAVRATKAYLGMSAADRAALARLDVLKALSGAKERIVASYALADETGRALREDATVQALRRLFPQMRVRGGLSEEEQLEMLSAPDPALDALSVRLSDAVDGKAALDPPFAQAAKTLLAMDGERGALENAMHHLAAPPVRRLNRARTLYGRPVMSVSRLETHAQCPFKHFVLYGLAPKRETEPGIDRAKLGTLYHEAAERFTRAVTALPGFPDVDGETCDRLMDEAVAPLIEAWRVSPLGSSARGAAIARRIGRTARRTGRNILSQFSESGFHPFQTELAFGKGGVAPVMLELADGSFVYLQGRIDRVDALDRDGRVIRVIDYKSGTKKFDPTMAYWGLQLQLLLYLAAALAQIPGARAAGFFYCRIADPTVKTESRIKEEVERQIAKKLQLAGISLSDVEILREQGSAHAAMLKKDGTPSGRYKSSMADEETLAAMVDYAKSKAASIAEAVYAGEIEAAPYEYGKVTACTNCEVLGICGFDPAVKIRRRIQKKSIADLHTDTADEKKT